MFVFHSSAVDSDSVGSHDAGTNLDMAAFAVEDLKCITAGNTPVELTFNETGMFNSGYNGGADNEALEQSLAILTVTDAATAVKVSAGNTNEDGLFVLRPVTPSLASSVTDLKYKYFLIFLFF